MRWRPRVPSRVAYGGGAAAAALLAVHLVWTVSQETGWRLPAWLVPAWGGTGWIVTALEVAGLVLLVLVVLWGWRRRAAAPATAWAAAVLAAIDAGRVPDEQAGLALKKSVLELEEARHEAAARGFGTIVQAVGALGLLVTLLITVYQVRQTQEAADRGLDQSQKAQTAATASLDLSRRGQIADRFTKAVEQLGTGQGGAANREVRMGGVFALESVMRDIRTDPELLYLRQAAVEVLTGYVRQNAPRCGLLDPAAALGPPQIDIQAALTVLGRRLLAYEGGTDIPVALSGPADLRGASLPGARLLRASLHDACLDGAILIHANLTAANLIGAHLHRANLGAADLQCAHLMGADLSRALLPQAVLIRADLEGADLARAQLSGANLTNARLMGADLAGADLAGAVVTGAFLHDAKGLTPEDLAALAQRGANTSRRPADADVQDRVEYCKL